MKRLILLAILILIAVTVFGQSIIPDWTQIVPGIWAKTPAINFDRAGMMEIASWAGSVHVDNARRLHEALKEIRAQRPDQFDAIFRSYGLAIDAR